MPSIDQEQAEEMATFCLAMGISPSEYLKLNRLEINAFWKVYQKINKKK